MDFKTFHATFASMLLTHPMASNLTGNSRSVLQNFMAGDVERQFENNVRQGSSVYYHDFQFIDDPSTNTYRQNRVIDIKLKLEVELMSLSDGARHAKITPVINYSHCSHTTDVRVGPESLQLLKRDIDMIAKMSLLYETLLIALSEPWTEVVLTAEEYAQRIAEEKAKRERNAKDEKAIAVVRKSMANMRVGSNKVVEPLFLADVAPGIYNITIPLKPPADPPYREYELFVEIYRDRKAASITRKKLRPACNP